jgi:hypothetical protein
MKWEYQIIRAATVEEFESLLNKLGGEGWEATSAGYAADEAKMVSLGHGMQPSIKTGALTWVALMKRILSN